jgi:hypothetical protein
VSGSEIRSLSEKVDGSWFLVTGAWFLVSGTWFLVSEFRAKCLKADLGNVIPLESGTSDHVQVQGKT